MKKVIPYLLILLLLSQAAAQELSVTRSKVDYLRDGIGLFDREQRKAITDLLEEQSKKPLGRIYLDILNELPASLTIEQYAGKRLNASPRMSGEKADKVMIVIVIRDKAVRIETSQDVRSKLPDDTCHEINREVMVPKFKTGAYFEG